MQSSLFPSAFLLFVYHFYSGYLHMSHFPYKTVNTFIFYSFIHSFYKMGGFSVWGIVLAPGDTAVTKACRVLSTWSLKSSGENT